MESELGKINTMAFAPPDSAKPRWELAQSLSWFDGRARTAHLMHPQPATDVKPEESRIGEPLLWPEHLPVPNEMASVVHLNRQDFPAVPFPGEAEVLQVIWRPGNDPVATAYWRTPGEIESMRPVSSSAISVPGWTLHPARLLPEPVIEYPSWFSLPRKIQRGYDAWFSKHPDDALGPPSYEYEFGPSPSSKVGGYAHWIWNDDTPTCECGSVMEHLFSLASTEFLDSGGRWGWVASNTRGEARKEATGLNIPKSGIAYFHACMNCGETPLRVLTQSL